MLVAVHTYYYVPHVRFLQFVQEMAAAWQATIDLKLGIFAPDEEEISPLMASDENVPEIKRPDVAAHRIWLKVCCTFIIKYSMCTCTCILVRAGHLTEYFVSLIVYEFIEVDNKVYIYFSG